MRLGRRDARRLAGRAAGLDEAGPAAVAAGIRDAAAARRRLHRRLALLWQCGLPVPVGGLHLDPEGVRGPPPARLCCLRQPPACPCLQRPIAFEQARRRRRLVRPAGLCACGAAAAAAVGTCQGLARSGRSVQRARGAHGMSPMPALVCRISRSQNVMRTMSTPLAAHASSVAQHPAPCPAQQPWPAGLPVRLLSLRLARSRVLLQCYPSTAEYPQASSARAR